MSFCTTVVFNRNYIIYILLMLVCCMLVILTKNKWSCDNTFVNPEGKRNYFTAENNRESKWKELLKCQTTRLKRLNDRCKELGLVPTKPLHEFEESVLQKLGNKYLVDDKHHIVLKAIPKTGCTSWKLLLLNNTMHFISWVDQLPNPHGWGSIKRNLGMYTLEDLNKQAILNRLDSYLTILSVRHPLARLESAFRDKRIGSERLATEMKILNNTYVYSAKVFEEFQQSVNKWKTGRLGNWHFGRFTNLSNPCTMPIGFIARTETANEDMRYIVEEKLSNIGSPIKANPSTKSDSKEKLSQDVYLELFSGLQDPERSIKDVIAQYKEDMYLFGYSYKITEEGVYATCENYGFNGMCC